MNTQGNALALQPTHGAAVTAATDLTAVTTVTTVTAVDAVPPGDERFQLPRLLHWLYSAGARRGHGRAEVARHLGVTYSYLQQLSTGARLTHNVSSDFCRACARYLDVPAVVVMVAVRRITLEDFALPRLGASRTQQLTQGLHRIADDPLVGCLLPPEVWDAPDSVKALLVALYEDATQQALFAPRSLPMLFQGLQDAAMLVNEDDLRQDAELLACQPRGEGR